MGNTFAIPSQSGGTIFTVSLEKQDTNASLLASSVLSLGPKYDLGVSDPTISMDYRQKRGMEIAATQTITRKEGNIWVVPSQSGTGDYTVDLGGDSGTCTCAAFQSSPVDCKHIYAAKYAQIRDENSGQNLSFSEVQKAIGKKGKSYSRDWPRYHKSQTKEGLHF